MAKLKAPFALDRSLNTTEQTSRNIADVLAEELSAIITALGGLNFINYEVVEELPTTEISTTTIYLVPSDDPQSGNTYDEYINLNGTVSGWEKIGSTAIDLSGYYTSAETDALLDEKVDKDSFDEQTATDEFITINGGLLSECKVALSPIQDLHGYEHPWVGGAGKNKLPLVLADIKAINTAGTWSGNVYSVSGGTIEVLVDDANNVIGIKPNGTFSATVIFYLVNNYTFKAGSYALNGCPTGGDSSTYELRIGNIIAQDYGSGATYTLGSDTMSMASIIIRSGQDMSGKNFYPMIRLATESDPTFAPYSNICPITGHTQVVFGDDGKNRCNESGFEVGTFNINSSVGSTYTNMKQSQSARGRSQGIIDTGNIQMTISCDSNYSVYLAFFDSDGLYTGSNYGWTNSYTFTSPYIAVMLKRNDGANIQSSDFENVHIQIEKGSIATPYVPYNGYQVTVNLGGTYYSGTLDVVTGVFVPDTAKYVLTDVSVLEAYTTDVSYGSLAKIKTTEYPSIKEDVSSELASFCKAVAFADRLVDLHDNRFFVHANDNSVLIRASVDENVTTINELFAIFENCEFILPLATPTPIQLSPTMVKALVGENYLSAPLDGQEITESKYRELFTWDEVESYFNAHSGGGSGMNYSTEEQVVGTWIDGKPLYQKTWDFGQDVTVGAWTSVMSVADVNIDVLVNSISVQNNKTVSMIEYWVDGTTLKGNSLRQNTAVDYVRYLTLQYTKTTD